MAFGQRDEAHGGAAMRPESLACKRRKRASEGEAAPWEPAISRDGVREPPEERIESSGRAKQQMSPKPRCANGGRLKQPRIDIL
jgi:hypothetical protein